MYIDVQMSVAGLRLASCRSRDYRNLEPSRLTGIWWRTPEKKVHGTATCETRPVFTVICQMYLSLRSLWKLILFVCLHCAAELPQDLCEVSLCVVAVNCISRFVSFLACRFSNCVYPSHLALVASKPHNNVTWQTVATAVPPPSLQVSIRHHWDSYIQGYNIQTGRCMNGCLNAWRISRRNRGWEGRGGEGRGRHRATDRQTDRWRGK